MGQGFAAFYQNLSIEPHFDRSIATEVVLRTESFRGAEHVPVDVEVVAKIGCRHRHRQGKGIRVVWIKVDGRHTPTRCGYITHIEDLIRHFFTCVVMRVDRRSGWLAIMHLLKSELLEVL